MSNVNTIVHFKAVQLPVLDLIKDTDVDGYLKVLVCKSVDFSQREFSVKLEDLESETFFHREYNGYFSDLTVTKETEQRISRDGCIAVNTQCASFKDVLIDIIYQNDNSEPSVKMYVLIKPDGPNANRLKEVLRGVLVGYLTQRFT